jgi:hypothetical protein
MVNHIVCSILRYVQQFIHILLAVYINLFKEERFTLKELLDIIRQEAQKYYDSRWVVVSFMGAGLIASIISLLTGTLGGFENSFLTGVWVQPSIAEWISALIMGLLA